MSNDNVIPYTQSRQTKLGLAVVTIKQEGDLWEATVTISYDDTIFKADGIFSSAREAFMFCYGVKQNINDGWAGYTVKDGMLVESHPRKGMTARISTIRDALFASKLCYDNFELSKTSSIGNDKVSMSAVKTSTLLSDEEKATMALLFAKLGKVLK